MKINKIKIKQIVPDKGHIGFVSMVIDDWLFLNNIAIFTRLNNPNQIRLVFPEKKIKNNTLSLFYPLTREAYYKLEEAVQDEFNRIIQS